MTHRMSVWPGFLDGLRGRSVFARIDVGFSAGDLIEFVAPFGATKVRRIVRKEPCAPDGWVLLTVV